MKYTFLFLIFSPLTYALDPVDHYSNGSTTKEVRQAQEMEESNYENRSLKGKQQKMEERRGWKGSSIEPAGSPPLKTYDVHPQDRKD